MKARQYIIAAILATATLTFCACEKDDTDFSSRINGSTNNDDSSDDEEPTIDIREIALDESDLDEGTETIPTAATSSLTYNDYWENSDWDYTVYIAYSGTTATVTGNTEKVSVETDGAYVTITSTSKHMHYIVSGTTGDGHLQIYSDNKYKLTLNGLTMKCLTRSAINNQCGKTMYVHLSEGTTNTLEDAASYTTATKGEDEKGAFFSEGQVIFSGKGRLDVFALGRGGIRSDDYIRIRPGVSLYIESSALDGLRANDGIIMDGGVINVTTSGNGAKGVRSGGVMTVNGGRLIALASGDTRIETTDEGLVDTTSCAGLTCDTLLIVNGGTLKFKATGDGGKGINAKHDIVIHGGNTVAVSTGTKELKKPKGVKLDGNFGIDGGYFYSYSKRSDPMEVAGRTTVAPGYKTYELGPKVLTIAY